MNQTLKERPIGIELNGDGKQFFDNVILDNLIEAFLELSAAVWTHRDRAIVLEKVLTKVLQESGQDVDVSKLIEDHRPSEEELAARAAERHEMVTTIFRGFSRRTK